MFWMTAKIRLRMRSRVLLLKMLLFIDGFAPAMILLAVIWFGKSMRLLNDYRSSISTAWNEDFGHPQIESFGIFVVSFLVILLVAAFNAPKYFPIIN